MQHNQSDLKSSNQINNQKSQTNLNTKSTINKINFSSLLQVKLDVQLIQNALADVLSDMNNRINTLSNHTTKIQKQSIDRFTLYDKNLSENSQRLNYIQEMMNQQQKRANDHQKKFQVLSSLDQSLFNQLNRRINGQKEGMQNDQGSSGNTNGNNNGNQGTYQRQNVKGVDFNLKSKKQIKGANNKKSSKENQQGDGLKVTDSHVLPNDNNNHQNNGNIRKISSTSTPLVGIPQLTQLQDKYQKRISQLQKNISKQMDQIKLGMQNLKVDTQISTISNKKPLLSKGRHSMQTNNNLASKIAQGLNLQNISTDKQINKHFTQQNLALSNLQQQLQNIRQQIDKRFNIFIQVNVQQVKNQIFNKVMQITDVQTIKIDQNLKTNSIITDHVLGLKNKIEDLKNRSIEDRSQIKNINDKLVGFQSQLFLLKQASKISKDKSDILDNKLMKIQAGLNNRQDGNQNSSQDNINQLQRVTPSSDQGQQHQINKSIKRGSVIRNRNSNINMGDQRSSILANIQNPNLINGQSLEQYVRKINQKVISLTDRINRWQDQRKMGGKDSKSSFFPKIQGSKGGNTPSFDIIKSQLKKLNDQLTKTNERLQSTKIKLSDLYDAHNLLPLQIQDLYKKLQQHHQFQQDRLLELIKELINRCLIDPFNNNFTNTLKRQINVKFLQIKHQYYGILKEIQTKVQDRAQGRQLNMLQGKMQESLLQIKSIVQKKCDSDDLKKGLKYLENKLKEVYAFVKVQAQINHEKNQNKCYVNLKKQF